MTTVCISPKQGEGLVSDGPGEASIGAEGAVGDCDGDGEVLRGAIHHRREGDGAAYEAGRQVAAEPWGQVGGAKGQGVPVEAASEDLDRQHRHVARVTAIARLIHEAVWSVVVR